MRRSYDLGGGRGVCDAFGPSAPGCSAAGGMGRRADGAGRALGGGPFVFAEGLATGGAS
jgi:hypothetical protein